MSNPDVAYGETTLPVGIRSRFVRGVNGITMHALEAGFEEPGRPLVLLLHGFPELAYSWRKVMLPLAGAGYHVVAPDQRGYGRTDGADVGFDDDLWPYTLLNHVRDSLALVFGLGHRSAASVVGHDYGSPVAAWCALARPDVFRSVVLMSAPFEGAPEPRIASADAPLASAGVSPADAWPALPTDSIEAAPVEGTPRAPDVHAELARLPQPRKHYHWYYSTRPANADMQHCRQGVHDFLRAYYHMKSADWAANDPFPLAAWSADELAKLPRYYVMDLDKDMAETVASEMPSAAEIAACTWLPDEELRVYSGEYARNGFQGGLQSYRVGTARRYGAELTLFAGRTIDVPAMFVGGARDWGVHQRAGRLDAMTGRACTDFRGVHLLAGAGHWVQQEQPEAVGELLKEFLQPSGGKDC